MPVPKWSPPGETAHLVWAGINLPQITTEALMFLQACPRALSRISNNLKDFRTDMRMSVIMCLSEHFPRVPRCYLSNAADWQAHFLGLRVQKTISCLTLITSQTPPANSARLLRVIGFSHLLSKRRRMSLLPCGPLSWDWDPQSCRFCAAQPRSWHAGGGRGPGPWQPTPSRKLSILQRGKTGSIGHIPLCLSTLN